MSKSNKEELSWNLIVLLVLSSIITLELMILVGRAEYQSVRILLLVALLGVITSFIMLVFMIYPKDGKSSLLKEIKKFGKIL